MAKNKDPNYCSTDCNYAFWHQIQLPLLPTAVHHNHYNAVRQRDRDLKEMIKWCENEVSDEWFVNANNYFYFKDMDDALLFKLMYS